MDANKEYLHLSTIDNQAEIPEAIELKYPVPWGHVAGT